MCVTSFCPDAVKKHPKIIMERSGIIMERSDIIKECYKFPLQYSRYIEEGSNLIKQCRCIALAIANDILEHCTFTNKHPRLIKHETKVTSKALPNFWR